MTIKLYHYDMVDKYNKMIKDKYNVNWDYKKDGDYPACTYQEYKDDQSEYDYETMGRICLSDDWRSPRVRVLVIQDIPFKGSRRIMYALLKDMVTVLDLFERKSEHDTEFFATDDDLIMVDNVLDMTDHYTFRIIDDKKLRKDGLGDNDLIESEENIQKYTKSIAPIVKDYFNYLDSWYCDDDEPYDPQIIAEDPFLQSLV